MTLFCRLECFQKSSQKQQEKQQQAASKLLSSLINFIPTFSDFLNLSEKHQSSSQQQGAASFSQEADRGRSSPQWFSFKEQTVTQLLLSTRGSEVKTQLLSDWLRVLLNSQSRKGCPPFVSNDEKDKEETERETQKHQGGRQKTHEVAKGGRGERG